jgi:hypothetical protein
LYKETLAQVYRFPNSGDPPLTLGDERDLANGIIELGINLKIAKSLGVTVSPSLLARTEKAIDQVNVCTRSLPPMKFSHMQWLRQLSESHNYHSDRPSGRY